DLDRPAGPEVEQVEQVGRPGDQRGVDRDVGDGAAGERGGRDPGRADAAQLDRAGGDLTVGQRAEVPADPAHVTGAGDVVVPAERPGTGGRGGQGGAGPPG